MTVEHFYRLRSAGLMIGESTRDLRLPCQLYALPARHLLSAATCLPSLKIQSPQTQLTIAANAVRF
jgi:hypothetical protein